MRRLIACFVAILLYLSAGAALTLPFTAAGCSGASGDSPSVAPGTDDRAKEQKEMDDFMQNANKPKGKAKAAH